VKVGSGVLTLQANDCIADSVGLILVSGSIIKLDFTGSPDVIASLKVNGVPQPPGIYGGPMSGAPISSLSLLALEECQLDLSQLSETFPPAPLFRQVTT
jgi:hypothetical protein